MGPNPRVWVPLAGNTFTTKAVMEILECVASDDVAGCESNPFYTPWPYALGGFSLVFSGGSLAILAVALRFSEALMAITVFEGCMILSGAFAGNIVLDESAGQTPDRLIGYGLSILAILAGLAVLLAGELRGTSAAAPALV